MSEPGGKRTAQMVASLSIAIGLGLVVVLAIASRKEPAASGTSPRHERGPDTLPDLPSEPGLKANAEKTGEPPRSVDSELAAKRGEMARSQWAQTKKLMEKTREDHLKALERQLQLPPERIQSIRTILQSEEEAWMKDFEPRLQPAFRGEGPPKYEFLQSEEYKSFVQGLAANSDRQIRPLLDEGHWAAFERWRTRYNRERYFTGVR